MVNTNTTDPGVRFYNLLQSVGAPVVNPITAGGLPVVIYCVDRISSIIASNSHHVMRITDQGKKRDLAHDQYRLINARPNHRMSQYLYTKTMVALMLLWGNGIAAIRRDQRGRPMRYDVWHPGRVSIDLIDGVLMYKNHLTNEVLDESDIIDVCDTIRDPDTYKGVGRIQLAYDLFQEVLYYNKFRKAFIKNGTHNGHAFIYPGKVDSDQAANLESKLNDKSGADNAGENLIFGHGVKIEKLGLPLKDSQMLETLQKQNVDIGLVFGFKPGQVGQQNGESFNSLEQYNIELLQYPVLPIAKAYVQEHTYKIMRLSEAANQCVEIDFSDMMRGSVRDRVELYKVLKPAITLNQLLQKEGYNTFDGGDVRIADLNTTTLDRLINGDSDDTVDAKELMRAHFSKNGNGILS